MKILAKQVLKTQVLIRGLLLYLSGFLLQSDSLIQGTVATFSFSRPQSPARVDGKRRDPGNEFRLSSSE